MRITLLRSGGFAGLDMVATVDAAELPDDQRDLVGTLLTIEPQAARSARPPSGADQFTYELEIVDGGRTVQRRWDEFAVPASVRPLLKTLSGLATPASRPQRSAE